MTSKLIPSDPEKIMVIRNVTPEILTLSVPFRRFGRVNIGGRATIVRMANGSLAAFSPVALTPEAKSRIAALGTMKYIIAPDLEHHIFLDDWHAAYPDAALIAPSALKHKRDKSNTPLPFTHLWRKDVPPAVDPAFDREFDYTFVDAHPNKELVFNHRPTRTLIQADYMFNLPTGGDQASQEPVGAVDGVLTRLFVALNNPAGTAVWQKRFLWYGMSGGDREGFNKCARTVDGWDFDRMIPCHGEVVEKGAKEVFRKVFAWHLQ